MHYWSVWHEGKPFSAYREVAAALLLRVRLPVVPFPRDHQELRRRGVAERDLSRHGASPEAPPGQLDHHRDAHPVLPRARRASRASSTSARCSRPSPSGPPWNGGAACGPSCMGTLYWQLNDTWPVCSWSSLEYSGKWKLLHYAAKRFYAPLLVAGFLVGDEVQIWAVNDNRAPAAGRLTATVMDFSGQEAAQRDPERASGCRALAAPGAATAGQAPGQRPARRGPRLLFPSPDASSRADRARSASCSSPSTSAARSPGHGCARAWTPRTAAEASPSPSPLTDLPSSWRSMHEGIRGEFDDNCFTLVPGRPRVVGFSLKGRATLAGFRKALRVRHLRDSYR